MDTFAIELEPTPFGVYLPGQTVKGSVVVANRTIVLFKRNTILLIYIIFFDYEICVAYFRCADFHVKAKGYAWTSYETSTIHNRHQHRMKTHTEREFYFNMTIPLVVIPDGGSQRFAPRIKVYRIYINHKKDLKNMIVFEQLNACNRHLDFTDFHLVLPYLIASLQRAKSKKTIK